MKTIDPLLLAVVRLSTSQDRRPLTRATGFLLRGAEAESVFLVTCRHVFTDPLTGHYPDQVQIDLHTDANNLAVTTSAILPLYVQGTAAWRQGRDAAGEVDVATLKLHAEQMPQAALWHMFPAEGPSELQREVGLGTPVLIVGFPMGFHDELHHLPVARSGIVASPYGWRFGGEGYFLTDARTHRGLSGAPVVVPDASAPAFPWRLLGIHSARLEGRHREAALDDILGLNCSWYPDILRLLTAG